MDKKKEKFNQWKKGFNPPPFRNMPRNTQVNIYNRNKYLQQKGDKTINLLPKGILGTPKEPMKCWECGEHNL